MGGETVQGSLDQPPIVVRSSQLQSFVLLVISMVFFLAGVLIPPKTAGGYLWIAFSGLGVLLFAWRCARPDILIVAPDGVTSRIAFRTKHWQWSDLQNFRPYSPAGRTLSKHLGFDFTDSYWGQSRRLRHTVKAITGVEGTLGGGWELSAACLADLLNKARIRWAGASPSRRT
jgi:hypothetical protein